MTSAALLDLQTRVNSNTLTADQQAALSTALGEIAPFFQEPDELANGIPPTEAVLARAWMAALYTIQAEFQGGSSVLPTQEANWYVNPVTGSDTNSGTSAFSPLATIAQIAVRWRGVAGGGRPQLKPSTGGSVTIHIQGDLPTTDPLAPVLDVDLVDGTDLIIKADGQHSAAHSGILATANAWARTNANGQVQVTDGTVADYSAFFATPLFQDTTTGAVAWLYAGAGTGIVSVGYSEQTPGSAAFPTQTAIAATDHYQLAAIFTATLGQGFETRSFPEQEETSGLNSNVFFYRLSFTEVGSAPQPEFVSPSVTYVLQECQSNASFLITNGATVSVVNCGAIGPSNAHRVTGGGLGEFLAGVSQATVDAQQGGFLILDQDFAVASDDGIGCLDGGVIALGACSRWGNSNALTVFGGSVTEGDAFVSGSAFYGSANIAPLQIRGPNGPGALTYTDTGSGHPAQDRFQFNLSTFVLGAAAGASGFGFNSGTGAYVGPTTNTLAHLDAALAAGTGFGSNAIDPATGCRMGLSA